MSIEVEYNYNLDEHYAPPIRIQWMARNAKRLTQMRWIFIHCCGQIGNVNGRNISSRFPCKLSSGRIIWNVTRRHHASQLQLLRTNHSHIIKYTPPLARWRCCHREIAAWDDAWSSRDRKIPFQYVDSGCLEGMYDCEAEPELDPDPCNFPTALVAIPLHRKPKTTATRKKSHSSSGLQTVVIEKNKLLDPHMINFTQNSVLKLFSDKNRPSIVETAVLIFKGNMKIEDIPTIRVASKSNSEADDFYTADNRRLFLHKILETKELRVDWIQWTAEFDGKLNQNIRFDPQIRFFVSKDAIIECRNDCYKSLLIKEGKTMDSGKIKFTKPSISTRFNDKELPTLIDTALMILRGEIMIEGIPTIRVATRSNIKNDIFYTLDNRRLFLFKLLNIEKVKVDWVEWTTEFDEKLNQNITCTRPDLRFSVGKDGIADCRNYCYESLLIEKGKTMDPRTIEFTKSSILKYFNDYELPSLLETALMILRGKMMIEEIPTIRVATRGGSENYIFYTLDNRRLFLFKLLNIEKVKVDWVEWTTEFDEKLNQNIKYDLSYHFRTYKDDIKKCRNNCYDSLLIERGKTMNPAKIQFTKSSVLKHFNDKELPSLLETALIILRGKMKIEEIPTIRIATRGGSENCIFYTLDNRRLFLFKLLNIEKVKVDWVEWTTDFDEKLNKDMKYDQSYRFLTDKDSIMKYRNNCYGCLSIERGKTMDPGKMKFTKSSVLKHFDDKELPSLLETALMILRGKIKIEEIPTIRVATRSNLENDDFYTADNRRLFLFKILKIKEVKADWVEWNLEFEQQFKNDSRFDSNLHFDLTDAVDIVDCRNECINDVCFKEKSERVFHVPSECVGFIFGNEGNTINLFRKIFGAKIVITPSSSSSPLLYSVSISKRKGSRNSFRPSAAKKRILKIAKKGYNNY